MQIGTSKSIRSFLDEQFEKYNQIEFIKNDPISLPHQFSDPRDIEIVALLVSTIAWGNRKSIISNGQRIIDIMQGDPYRFIINYKESFEQKFHFVHRTFNAEDLCFFFLALQSIYQRFGTLENSFYLKPSEKGIQHRIANFRNEMLKTEHLPRSEKHISNPLKGSAAKRLNMFLRWMVRKDSVGVDFGIWNTIQTSELHIPLDVHTANSARKIGLLSRKQNDWKAVEEIQTYLVKFDPDDPCKYDFALFGMGLMKENFVF